MKVYKNLFLGLVLFLSNLSLAATPYVGIGIQMSLSTEGIVYITKVFQGGPAERAGVLVNEALFSVDNIQLLKGSSALDQAAQLIKGNALAGSLVILGVGPNATASRSLTVVRETIYPPCLISGQVRLNLFGDLQNGYLRGWIDNEMVDWSVTNGTIRASSQGHFFWLDARPMFQSDFEITGWIAQDYVHWRSMGNMISEYVSCLGK